MKILIVDDQEENCYLLETLLKGAGYEVGSASNGKEALAALQHGDYHMVVSDILMPVMDGFQLCHRIKSDEILKRTAFVFFTATYIERDDENLAQKIGADGFIRKPIDPGKLLEIINQLIREHEEGKVKTPEKLFGDEEEVFKLYNQRLVSKLEEKMLNLEKEIRKRLQAEEELKLYYSQLEVLVEERTAELTQTNRRLEQEIAERKKTEEALREEEEKFEALFKGAPLPTYIWIKTGEDFILVDYNDAGEKITEGKISQYVGKTAVEMYGDLPSIIDDFKQCFSTRDSIQREMSYRFRATGKDSHLIVTYAFVPPDFIILHTLDITQRRQAEEALKKARDQLEVLVEERTFELSKSNRQLRKEIDEHKQTQEALIKEKEKAQQYLDIAGVMMVAINRDQTVGLINKKGCEILGYRCEDIVGKNWFHHFLPERERDGVKNVFSLLMQGQMEPVEYYENPVLTKDGEERLMAWHNALIKDTQGKILGSLSSGQDITERKIAEELIIQTEKMMSVAGIAAGIAHEINNPLAGILMGTQGIRDRLSLEIPANVEAARECGTSLEAIRAYFDARKISPLVDTVKGCGERAAAIVENMLNFSRKSISKPYPHNLAELMDKSIALAESEYDLRKKYDFLQVSLVREYEPGLPMVPCEGTQIQQVFFNLLRNAAQALSEAKTPSPRIIVRIKREGDKARVEVEDNGSGIPDHLRKEIFKPFFTTKTEGSGTGLGLHISYFIITDYHHGTMEVESTPGQGTTFILRLPLHPDSP